MRSSLCKFDEAVFMCFVKYFRFVMILNQVVCCSNSPLFALIFSAEVLKNGVQAKI
jgi:hypothetical protein